MNPFVTLVAVLISLPSAALASDSRPTISPTISIDCAPTRALGSPVQVGWDALLEVVAVRGDYEKMEIETRILNSFENRRETVKTVYETRLSETSAQALYLEPLYPQPEGRDSGLGFSAVVFHIGDMTTPPTPGPVPPGTYPADASLVLLAPSRGVPGGPLRLRTVQVDLACAIDVQY